MKIIKKTHFIIFSKGRPSKPVKPPTNLIINTNSSNNNPPKIKINFKPKLDPGTKLIIDGTSIDRKSSTKFLGVIVDERLSFTDHIKYTKGKIARGLGILYKSRRILDKSTLTQLYNSFLCPYLNYCITVWGNTLPTYLAPIESIQRRAIRVISHKTRRDDVQPLFKERKILTFKELYAFNIQIIMYKFYHKDLPKIFEPLFSFNRNLHRYETKSQHNLHVALGRTPQSSLSIRVIGARSYNHFINLLEIKCHIFTYKLHLKNYLHDNGADYLNITT